MQRHITRPRMLQVLALGIMLAFAAEGYAAASVNVIDVRQKYRDEYTGQAFDYEPGSPLRQIEKLSIKYTISGSNFYRFIIYDRGANRYVQDVTIYHSSTSGTYWLNLSWIWKRTPDSYEVRAYEYHGVAPEWQVNDTTIGPVTADDNSVGPEGRWSPNQYTWGIKSNEQTFYVDYTQYLWWFDHPSSNHFRGTERLNHFKSHTTWPGAQLQHEFRRTVPDGIASKEGWDAYYIGFGGYLTAYGALSNMPDWRIEGEEMGLPGPYQGDEEAQILAEDPQSFVVDSGSDPTNFYYQGYWSRMTFRRLTGYTGQSFWMRTEFEMKESSIDTQLDVAGATIHTTTF